MTRILTLLLAGYLLVSCSAPSLTISIIGTNDVHGVLNSTEKRLPNKRACSQKDNGTVQDMPHEMGSDRNREADRIVDRAKE